MVSLTSHGFASLLEGSGDAFDRRLLRIVEIELKGESLTGDERARHQLTIHTELFSVLIAEAVYRLRADRRRRDRTRVDRQREGSSEIIRVPRSIEDDVCVVLDVRICRWIGRRRRW